jgi:hypothetical protein
MKTVFSSIDDVIHAYAQRPNDPNTEGRTSGGGNVFFDGGKLYSYGRHYILAEWIDDQTVMIDDRGYSVSTAKHISKTRYALNQYRQFFTTEAKTEIVKQRLESYRQSLAKARKPETYINAATYLIGKHVEYLEYVQNAIDPSLFELIQHFTGEGMKERIEADKERIEAQRKEDERKRKEYERLYRDAFMRYEPSGDYRSRSKVDYDLIRFKKDEPQTVETSQNVRIPYAVALEAFTRFKGYGLMKGQHVAGFTIHEIAPEFIRIGCHRFRIEDLNQFFNIPTV